MDRRSRKPINQKMGYKKCHRMGHQLRVDHHYKTDGPMYRRLLRKSEVHSPKDGKNQPTAHDLCIR